MKNYIILILLCIVPQHSLAECSDALKSIIDKEILTHTKYEFTDKKYACVQMKKSGRIRILAATFSRVVNADISKFKRHDTFIALMDRRTGKITSSKWFVGGVAGKFIDSIDIGYLGQTKNDYKLYALRSEASVADPNFIARRKGFSIFKFKAGNIEPASDFVTTNEMVFKGNGVDCNFQQDVYSNDIKFIDKGGIFDEMEIKKSLLSYKTIQDEKEPSECISSKSLAEIGTTYINADSFGYYSLLPPADAIPPD